MVFGKGSPPSLIIKENSVACQIVFDMYIVQCTVHTKLNTPVFKPHFNVKHSYLKQLNARINVNLSYFKLD